MDRGEDIVGLKVYMSNDNAGFFLTVNEIFAFYYVISTFNMFQSAQLMLAYLGRPEAGVNYYGINGMGSTVTPHRSPISGLTFSNAQEPDFYGSNMKMNSKIKSKTTFLQRTGGTEKEKEKDKEDQ